ncbi:MAG: 50S ribosomal protein L29 [Fidelibacterota bacterium]
MKKSELKNMTETELKSRLSDDLEELENLRFQKALQQLENPVRIRLLRREVAQIRTVLREFELNIRTPEGGE